MAIDRWFGGISAKHNMWRGATMITDDEHDFYFLGFDVQSSDLTNGVKWVLYGSPESTVLNPAQEEITIFSHPKVTSFVQSEQDYIIKLKEKTRLFPTIQANASGAATHIAFGDFGVLPKREDLLRTHDEILAAIRNGRFLYLNVAWSTADTNIHVCEDQIDSTKPIIQPYHAATPAVADELFVSSTSANDTLLGTGAQKITFDYYDASLDLHEGNVIEMNGATPVDLISLYDDVAYIKQVYSSKLGSLGHNDGDIFFHDTAA